MSRRHGTGPGRHPEDPQLAFSWPTWSKDSPAGRFVAFHEANPHIYLGIVWWGRHYRDATGATRLSMQMLIENARCQRGIATKTDEEWKINNTFVAYYSRLVMAQEPDLDGMFEIRKSLDADEWIEDYTRQMESV